MGACASFPKGMKDEAREAQLPEQPKDVDPTAALSADETDKEIIKLADGEEKKEQDGSGDNNKAKEDEEKAIESSNKEGEITEATKATLTEEDTTLLASAAKVEIATTLVVPITRDENKETTEFKDEK